MTQVQDARIQKLNNAPIRDRTYVLYWMQASQRAEDNYALEYAVQRANELNKPLLVAFGLMDDYPDANLRHYLFMLEGLKEVQESLERRKIKMVVQKGAPPVVAETLGQEASLVVTDMGYLRLQRQWRKQLAGRLNCQLIQVEDNVVVPVELASNKAEYGARTLRPKLQKHVDHFLLELRTSAVKHSSLELEVESLDLKNPGELCASLKLNREVAGVSNFFSGGTRQAKTSLHQFLEQNFDSYADNRNQPQTSDTSYMAMYLHFGQISPIYIALKAKEAKSKGKNIESFLEELIVRRELAMNFTHFNDTYDDYSVLPDWAKKTLNEHKKDKRDPHYSLEQLEKAQTHDPYWNAAMKEMRFTGYMHNYMRMYWGKKLLEWSPDPEEGFKRTLFLNNKYFLDGRDPNSFTGVAWCYGQHDRAWQERAIFGKIRYMNANGLKAKSKPDEYVKKVNKLVAKATGESLTAVEQASLF
ncbi:MAG: deoxyribodipyrimidine photo-lyase [Trueperaceae bacterium]|nr:deoxyribodipyrimidine photo-lyase [Trueperaceae bacterium]